MVHSERLPSLIIKVMRLIHLKIISKEYKICDNNNHKNSQFWAKCSKILVSRRFLNPCRNAQNTTSESQIAHAKTQPNQEAKTQPKLIWQKEDREKKNKFALSCSRAMEHDAEMAPPIASRAPAADADDWAEREDFEEPPPAESHSQPPAAVAVAAVEKEAPPAPATHGISPVCPQFRCASECCSLPPFRSQLVWQGSSLIVRSIMRDSGLVH